MNRSRRRLTALTVSLASLQLLVTLSACGQRDAFTGTWAVVGSGAWPHAVIAKAENLPNLYWVTLMPDPKSQWPSYSFDRSDKKLSRTLRFPKTYGQIEFVERTVSLVQVDSSGELVYTDWSRKRHQLECISDSTEVPSPRPLASGT